MDDRRGRDLAHVDDGVAGGDELLGEACARRTGPARGSPWSAPAAPPAAPRPPRRRPSTASRPAGQARTPSSRERGRPGRGGPARTPTLRAVLLTQVDTPSGPARLHVEGSGPARLVLGHGAGGGVDAPDLVAARSAGLALGLEVVRVEQPWRVRGRRVAEAPPRLDAAWLGLPGGAARAAVRARRSQRGRPRRLPDRGLGPRGARRAVPGLPAAAGERQGQPRRRAGPARACRGWSCRASATASACPPRGRGSRCTSWPAPTTRSRCGAGTVARRRRWPTSSARSWGTGWRQTLT